MRIEVSSYFSNKVQTKIKLEVMTFGKRTMQFFEIRK